MAIKILIGGSPCTYWSIAQTNNRETKADGIGWELFKNYLIAKEKFKPDFFLYENNKSAALAIKDQIADEFRVGVDPKVRFTYINSALVSAQNRKRFYVTNFGDIEQPEDRGILLKDILETDGFMRAQGVLEPVNTTPNGKSQTIKAQYQRTSARNICCYDSTYGATGVAEPVCMRYERSEQGAKTGLYAIPTLIVPENTKKGYIEVKCGDCFDYEMPNSKTRRGRNMPNKSNCLTTGCNFYQYFAYATEFDADGKPTKAVSCVDGKTYTVYKVENGLITIKGKTYPIKLIDGYYIIRKLTVTECCRLQTMPDDYCKAVSDSQAYKALGNGWTAEVIIHLLNHALKNVPRDEEIVVLSMYDGIATGMYCLDKMGFTNVKYHAYEIDKYPIMVAMDNYPDIIQHGDAFAVREDDWKAPQPRSKMA